jgi:hypothetical protein
MSDLFFVKQSYCSEKYLSEQTQVAPPPTSSCGGTAVSHGRTSLSWRFFGTSFSAFLALPSHTSSRENDVLPVVAVAMRHPTQVWSLIELVGPGRDAHRYTQKELSYSAATDRSPPATGKRRGCGSAKRLQMASRSLTIAPWI